MKILPTLAEVKKLASDAKYNVLPVSYEMLSDFTTPIETMKILKNVSTHCYMLESAQANETWGRYTFLGFNPKLEITCMDGEMKIGNLKVKTENPSGYLRQILADYKSPRFAYLPSFTGGLVGYFSYDYLGYSEPSVKCIVEDVPITDDEAVNAFEYLAKTEGIIPAIESAHAVAHAMKIAPMMEKDKIIVITISGRGDKDCAAIARYRGEDIHE